MVERRILAVFLLSVVTFVMLVWMWDYWAYTPLDFTPDLKIFLFYSLFYLFGWLLFKSNDLLSSFQRYDLTFVILAFVIFTVKYIFRDHVGDVLYGGLNTLVGWLFIFGIIGLFVRYTSKHSVRMRYISDASYWVYLVHLPLTLIIPGLIGSWPVPLFIKFLLVVLITTATCFASYHFMVRATFIGKFLNGRRYPVKKGAQTV